MSKLFNVEVNTINYHLKEIFKSEDVRRSKMELLRDYQDKKAFRGRIPKSQAHKMAVLWGEDSLALQTLIEYCIQNDIKTSASCKGHKETDRPYIVFGYMPKDFVEHMLGNMEEEEGLLIDGEISRFGDHKPELALYSKGIGEAEEFFEDILDWVNGYINEKHETPSLQKQELINLMYSREGMGKSVSFSKYTNSKIGQMPELMIRTNNNRNKVIYGYSPLRRLCRESKKSISQIAERGKLFMDRVFRQQNIEIEGREKDDR